MLQRLQILRKTPIDLNLQMALIPPLENLLRGKTIKIKGYLKERERKGGNQKGKGKEIKAGPMVGKGKG